MREKLQETMRLPFFLKRTPEGTPDELSSAHPFPFVTEIGEGQLKSNHIFLLHQSILLILAHCVTLYLFIDASREVDEGNKGDDSGDNEFPNEEQEVGHLVKNCHPYLGRQLSKVILKFSAGCSPYF